MPVIPSLFIRRTLFGVALFVVLVGAVAYHRVLERAGSDTGERAQSRASSEVDRAGPPAPAVPVDDVLASDASPSDKIDAAFAFVASSGDPQRNRVVLAALRQALQDTKRPAESARAIVGFLDSGRDAETGLPFAVGPLHFLESAPTLRVDLLDLLGALEVGMAADYADKVFAAKTSADEWAIALRHLAGGPDPDSLPRLEARFLELYRHPEWRAEPSAGFLHAMDVPVFLGATHLVPALAAEVVPDSGGSGLSYAASLAIDRLAQNHPSGTLGALGASLETLDSAPTFRASIFARADVSNPSQRALVELYLAAPSITDGEVRDFLDHFPNGSIIDSHNLLTDLTIVDLQGRAAADLAALEVVRQWGANPRFAGVRESLDAAEARIASYVESARAGGISPVSR